MEPTSIILVVDDEPVGRDTLEALLTNQGYQLAFAGDGPEALARAAQIVPDLILLDVMMPGMDGYEVCRRLREDALLGEVPIIMVTALDDRDSRLQGIEAGADDFVSKPFNRLELRARVRTITRLNRYRRLLAERARFEWVVENAADGYLVLDPGDGVRYANVQARIYLGLLDRSAVPGVGFMELARRQYRCEPQENWAQWPSTSLALYLVRPESETATSLWLQVDELDIGVGNGTDRIMRLRDVTEQMAQNRDIRSFHRVVTHKVRTPLTGMMSGLELLARAADRLSPEEIATFAQSGLSSAIRLREALEDILGYLGAAGLAKGSERFELGQLEGLLAEFSANVGIEPAVLSMPQDLASLSVLLSRRGFELTLWEILENAKKFHPVESPQVNVVVSRVGQGMVSVKVIDDGVSISPEHLGQIWTPYYQGEKYFTGEALGMGLGLATVAALVWEVGGSCRALNRADGPGVIIELHLPVEAKSVA